MSELLYIEQYRKSGLRFTPKSNVDMQQLPIELIALFEKYERDGFRLFALDLKNLKNLPDDLLVLILEITARLRRHGGDLHIDNLHYRLLEDMLVFNPKKYLTLATKEAAAQPETEAEPNVPPQAGAPADAASFFSKIESIDIPYNEDDLYKACDFVTTRAAEMGFDENDLSRIKIAVYEACLNAIQHTRKMNPGDKVTVEVEVGRRSLQVNVYDRGIGFNPEKTREYDVTEAAQHRKTGGMGLHIIRRAMDEVDYQMDNLSGNRLVMIKHLKK